MCQYYYKVWLLVHRSHRFCFTVIYPDSQPALRWAQEENFLILYHFLPFSSCFTIFILIYSSKWAACPPRKSREEHFLTLVYSFSIFSHFLQFCPPPPNQELTPWLGHWEFIMWNCVTVWLPGHVRSSLTNKNILNRPWISF